MSIVIEDFGDYYDEDYYGVSSNTTSDNLTLYTVDPKTLSCEAMSLDHAAAVALCVLLVGIFILAIPGNLLVGWVIVANRKALTPSDVYLFHLTVADGLLALTLPFWATALTQGWIFGDFLCKVVNLLREANFYASILFLVCISVDRYLVIVHAADTNMARRQICSWVVCAAVWVLGCALALPALFNNASKSEELETMVCSEEYDSSSATTWRRATRALRHILGFLLPLVIMVTCYGIIIARLLLTRGFQKYRAMRVILAVVIAFLLCWMPYHLTVIIDSLMRADLISFTCAMRNNVNFALLFTHCLGLLHTGINPVLYAFVGAKFKNKIWMLLPRKFRQERMSASRISRSTSQTSEATTFL
ncbi:C-X-C chemokine receptor type 2-like [Diretmus argenteus]